MGITGTVVLGIAGCTHHLLGDHHPAAATKATASDVKAFARQMERDHHALRKAGQDLAKKLNITPAPPANDTLPATATKMHDTLAAAPKGA